MNFKSFLFRFSTVTATFILGISFFSFWNRMPSLWSSADNDDMEKQKPFCQPLEPNSQPIVTTTITEPAPTPPESVSDVSEPDPINVFDEEGYFYIVGQQPRAFADFEKFDIQYWQYDKKKDQFVKIAPTGYVDAKKEFKFKNLSLGQQYISFETKKVGGISYRLSGKLLDKVKETNEDWIYLEGHLEKLKNGVVIAEGEFKFGWSVYGC